MLQRDKLNHIKAIAIADSKAVKGTTKWNQVYKKTFKKLDKKK